MLEEELPKLSAEWRTKIESENDAQLKGRSAFLMLLAEGREKPGTTDSQINQWRDDAYKERDAASKERSLAQDKVESQLAELRLAKLKLAMLLADEYLIGEMPSSDIRTKTDSNGGFKILLPRFKGRYALYVNTKRKVLDGDEHYVWLVWADTSNTPILLANDNLFETKCTTCVKP